MTSTRKIMLAGTVIAASAAITVTWLFHHAPSFRPGDNKPLSAVEPQAGPPATVRQGIPTELAASSVQPRDASLLTSDSCPLTPNLQTLLGLTDPTDLDGRRAALRTLTRHLATNDIAALLAFLEQPPGDYQRLKPLQYNAIRNDILDVLVRQDRPVPGLGARMAAMFRNTAQDDLWRDYCIQYFAPYYAAAWPAGEGGNAAEDGKPAKLDPARREIVDAYWEAVARPDKTFAGTALLGMERLSREYKEFDRERIAGTALTLASDENTGEATRITALRVCGLMKQAGALETARIVVQTGTTFPLRLAAIATLGDLGDRRDREYLQALATVEGARFKPAIERAAKAIQDREGHDHG